MTDASSRPIPRAPSSTAPRPLLSRVLSAAITSCAARSTRPTGAAPGCWGPRAYRSRPPRPDWRRAPAFRLRSAALGCASAALRVAAIEYQGSNVKLRLETDGVEELTVTMPDHAFYADAVTVDDAVAVGWDDADTHVV